MTQIQDGFLRNPRITITLTGDRVMSVNKVILVGRCGNDPEVRNTDSGTAVANVRLATQEPNDASPEWHNLTFFGGKAELIGQHGKKGKQLFVEGKLRTKSRKGLNGVEYRTSEVVVSDFRFLDKAPRE
jgi:single-strand DNA-binding protein